PFSARPSTVTMLAPSAWQTGTRQLFTSLPSTSTEHAPHSPSPQPSFTPVNLRSTRSASSSLCIGHTSIRWSTPLTCSSVNPLGICQLRCLHQHFRCGWNAGYIHSNRILNSIEHRRRRAINRELSNSLGSHGAVWVRILLKDDAYRGNVH